MFVLPEILHDLGQIGLYGGGFVIACLVVVGLLTALAAQPRGH